MSQAKLREESVNRSNLYPGPATTISQVSRLHVILAIGHKERHCGKSFQNLRASFWTSETLQDFLENKACRYDRLGRFDCAREHLPFFQLRRRIASERKRPNAGIDEKAQAR